MKLLLLSLFLAFSGCSLTLAQSDKIQLPESKIFFFKNIIDSLSYFIQSGNAVITNSECLLPEHKLITVWKPYSRFPITALKIKGTLRDEYIEMYAISDMANSHNSVLYLEEALEIAIKYNFEYEELHNWRARLNNIFFHEGDYVKAMGISTDGLAKAEKLKDLERMEHINNVLGYIMMRQGNFELARGYFSTHLHLTRQIKNKEEEAKALLNLADLSLSEKKGQQAIPFINEALHIYKSFMPENTGRQAYTINKLAETYRLMERKKAALQYALQAIELVKKTGGHNQYDIAAYYINAGYGYNQALKPDSSLIYSRIGLGITQEIKHRELMRDAYEQLSLSYAIQKKFDSAYIYQRSFTKLNDSILKETSQRDILQREANLQVARQKRIQEVELSRQQLGRNIIIGIAIFTLVIVILLYNRRGI